MSWIRTAIVVATLAAATGCRAMPWEPPAPPLDPETEKPVRGGPDGPEEFHDLPVPAGFVYNPDQSFRNHTNYIAARLTYERSSAFNDLEKLVEFYEEYLPDAGWTIKFVYGERTRHLMAVKGKDQCEVVIARKFRTNTTVIVVKRSSDEEVS